MYKMDQHWVAQMVLSLNVDEEHNTTVHKMYSITKVNKTKKSKGSIREVQKQTHEWAHFPAVEHQHRRYSWYWQSHKPHHKSDFLLTQSEFHKWVCWESNAFNKVDQFNLHWELLDTLCRKEARMRNVFWTGIPPSSSFMAKEMTSRHFVWWLLQYWLSNFFYFNVGEMHNLWTIR